jgi:hypothetical protein
MRALTTPTDSGVNDWRFIEGRWNVHHRRLVARLAGSDEWQEFEGTSELWPLMGGAGTVDDNVPDMATPRRPKPTGRLVTGRSRSGRH